MTLFSFDRSSRSLLHFCYICSKLHIRFLTYFFAALFSLVLSVCELLLIYRRYTSKEGRRLSKGRQHAATLPLGEVRSNSTPRPRRKAFFPRLHSMVASICLALPPIIQSIIGIVPQCTAVRFPSTSSCCYCPRPFRLRSFPMGFPRSISRLEKASNRQRFSRFQRPCLLRLHSEQRALNPFSPLSDLTSPRLTARHRGRHERFRSNSGGHLSLL